MCLPQRRKETSGNAAALCAAAPLREKSSFPANRKCSTHLRNNDAHRFRWTFEGDLQLFDTLHRLKTSTSRNIATIASCFDNQLLTGVPVDGKTALRVSRDSMTNAEFTLRHIRNAQLSI